MLIKKIVKHASFTVLPGSIEITFIVLLAKYAKEKDATETEKIACNILLGFLAAVLITHLVCLICYYGYYLEKSRARRQVQFAEIQPRRMWPRMDRPPGHVRNDGNMTEMVEEFMLIQKILKHASITVFPGSIEIIFIVLFATYAKGKDATKTEKIVCISALGFLVAVLIIHLVCLVYYYCYYLEKIRARRQVQFAEIQARRMWERVVDRPPGIRPIHDGNGTVVTFL